MARPNWTGARRLSYQYRGPASGPSSHWPVIAEIIGIRGGAGVMPSRAARTCVADPLHLRAVGGVVHRQDPGADPGRLARGGQLGQGVRVTGDHGGAGAVDRGYRQAARPSGDPVADGGGVLGDRDHAAVAG